MSKPNGHNMRNEEDFLGKVSLPADALYGIHALRASRLFDNCTVFPLSWYRAIGLVKQACYQTTANFISAAGKKHPGKRLPYGCENPQIFIVLEEVAAEVAAGHYFDSFIVPALQGGAGTAINMNINEIICNAALLKTGGTPGDYHRIDPFIHANIFQSTNDVIPSALKLALMRQLQLLEDEINRLRSGMERHEKAHRSSLRLAYTQMQQAVPSSFGILFSSFSDALSRDWWRISKCFERIKTINLGGGATGTGIAIPRFFIMEVVPVLRRLCGLPLTRSENIADTTQNMDAFVEIHATLKANAVNLEKIAADIRILSSDLIGQKEMLIPRKMVGSSIMPGKVNPVISEFVIACSHKIYCNDMLISSLCGQGCLDLNPYLPVFGAALLESIHLLVQACHSLNENLIAGLEVVTGAATEKLFHGPAITTALLPHVGYKNASRLAVFMRERGVDIHEANDSLKVLEKDVLEAILRPENLLKMGFSLMEI